MRHCILFCSIILAAVGCITTDGSECPAAQLEPCRENSDCCGFDPVGYAAGETQLEYCSLVSAKRQDQDAGTVMFTLTHACTRTCTSDPECGDGFQCMQVDVDGKPSTSRGTCLPKGSSTSEPFSG